MKVELAHEKSVKAEAQANIYTLRKELQALKDQHEAAFMIAQQESAKATEEHLATKDALHKELLALKDQHEAALMIAQQESAKATEEHLATKDALRKELQALKDKHEAALVTAQQESARATEEHLATKDALLKAQAEVAAQKAADKEALVKELEANLKVKDAEIAELKVSHQIFIHKSYTHQCAP